MNIQQIANKIFAYKIKDNAFSLGYEKQQEYVNSFGEPKNDILRSFFQYKSQMHFQSWKKIAIMNIIFWLAIIPVCVFLLLLRTDTRKKEKAVTIYGFINDNYLPEQLSEIVNTNIANETGRSLKRSDIKYILALIKNAPFSGYFNMKCIYKMAQYSAIIDGYNPEIIIASSEYSFTSSFITWYCECNGVEHINVMHGEKLFNIRDSFFRFSKFYIWDEHYKQLFIELRADRHQFCIFSPKILSFGNCCSIKKTVDFTYYLQAEDKKQLIRIADSLKKLRDKGYKVKVRKHPLYSNASLVEYLFDDELIEGNIDIFDSILQSKAVIGLYSTVLLQAYNSQVDIIIDDISDYEKFLKLKELHYIMTKKPYRPLSEILTK